MKYYITHKIEGSEGGNTVEITKDTFTVGRHGDLATPLGLNCVSRLHFGIFRHRDGCYIRDLNSHCGTRVKSKSEDGMRSYEVLDANIGNPSGEVKLRNGDEISIGIDARPKILLTFTTS